MQKNFRQLISLGRLLSFDASKGLPEKVTLFKWGRNETVNGPVIVNDLTLSTVPRMQKAAGFDTVALDYEHNTVPGSPEYNRSQEPRPVAAHGVPFVRAGEGIGIELLAWTPSGNQNAANYVDLSAAASLTEKREVMFLHSGTLCRQGAADGIHLFTAGISNEGNFITNIKGHRPMNKLIISLFTAIGLTAPKEDATDEQLTAAAQELLSKLKAAPPDLSTFTTRLDEMKMQLAGIVSGAGKDAGAAIQTFTTRIEAMEGKFIGLEREGILTEAAWAGKVVPKEVLPDADGKGGLAMPALRTFVAALPVTVPLAQRTPPAIKLFTAAAKEQGDAPSSIVTEIRNQLGTTEDDVKKFGKKS